MKTFDEWIEENEDEIWISFHESGAYLELDNSLEAWAEYLYERRNAYERT